MQLKSIYCDSSIFQKTPSVNQHTWVSIFRQAYFTHSLFLYKTIMDDKSYSETSECKWLLQVREEEIGITPCCLYPIILLVTYSNEYV